MKRPILCVISGALALLLGACSGDEADQGPFFFVQLSDPQLGMYGGDSTFLQEMANLELAVATANRLRPAFVIVTGDLVNQAGNREAMTEYARIMSKLDRSIPLHNVAGNHDVLSEPTPKSIETYSKRFGPCHYSFRSGNLLGIVLNSSVIASPGKAREMHEEQEKWLRSELEEARRDRVRHIVVFQHHPWYLESVNEEGSYANIPLPQRARYLALFREYGVRTLIGGHLHEYTVARDGGFQMIASGSVGQPRGDSRSGLAVVSVSDAGIEHRFHDFGALPNRVLVR
jgi:3',5'-cyclic AMP phosphodiesterase CpdA